MTAPVREKFDTSAFGCIYIYFLNKQLIYTPMHNVFFMLSFLLILNFTHVGKSKLRWNNS